MVVGSAALKVIWVPILDDVEAGLDGGEAWTPQHYSVIVQSILSSPYQAVPAYDAKRSIGITALEISHQANLLSCRLQSSESPYFSSHNLCPACHWITNHIIRCSKFADRAGLSPQYVQCAVKLSYLYFSIVTEWASTVKEQLSSACRGCYSQGGTLCRKAGLPATRFNH